MKKIFYTLVFFAFCAIRVFAENENSTKEENKASEKTEPAVVEKVEARPYYNVVSFNMLFNLKHWRVRKEVIKSMFRFYDMDIIGSQENSAAQSDDIIKIGGYQYVGKLVGTKGSVNAIFYRTKYFRVLSSGQFWFNPNPETRGKGWDSFEGQTRSCTWAKFEEKANKKVFYVFNVHLNHLYHNERVNSSHVLKKKALEIAGPDATLIFTGDFNDMPNSEVIQYLTRDGFINDSRLVCQTPLHRPKCSSHGFTGLPIESVIDHVLVTKDITVYRYAVLTDGWLKFEIEPPRTPEEIGSGDNGFYPSDHHAVMARIKFQ